LPLRPTILFFLLEVNLSILTALSERTSRFPPKLNYRRKLAITGFLFVVPSLAFFAAFAFWPMINAFYLSFFEYDLLTPKEWVGIQQYVDLFQSKVFINSLKTTIIYAFAYAVPIMVISLALAIMLNQNIRFRTFFRATFFSPIVMPLVVLAIIWSLFLHPFGPFNAVFLKPFTDDLIPWLRSTDHALFAVTIMAVWRAVGYYTVIFLAGLQNIPPEYYEAARIDGASNWKVFQHITWPLLKPTTLFIVIISVINALRHFDAIWIMTLGGPGDATRVLAVLIYETGLVFLRMGRASAMSVIMFIMVMAFTVFQLRFFRGDLY
jgi:multiple sugar transport system permease protein